MADKKPDCVKCGWVAVDDGNIEFIEIIDKYKILLNNGNGGIQSSTIQLIIDNELKDPESMTIDEFIQKVNYYYTYGFKSRDQRSSTRSLDKIQGFLDGGNNKA